MTIHQFLLNLHEKGYKITQYNNFGSYVYRIYYDNAMIAYIDTNGKPAIMLSPFVFHYSGKIGATALNPESQKKFTYDLDYLNSLIKFDKYDASEVIEIQSLILTDGLLEKCLEYIYYCVKIYEGSRGITKTENLLKKINKARNK